MLKERVYPPTIPEGQLYIIRPKSSLTSEAEIPPIYFNSVDEVLNSMSDMLGHFGYAEDNEANLRLIDYLTIDLTNANGIRSQNSDEC